MLREPQIATHARFFGPGFSAIIHSRANVAIARNGLLYQRSRLGRSGKGIATDTMILRLEKKMTWRFRIGCARATLDIIIICYI
jgi:hypothetical protein